MDMPQFKRTWTTVERDALPNDSNRYEVIDGELFVTPAPTWRHQDAVLRLHALIAEYLRHEPVGHALVAPADVVFTSTRAVQPDLFVVPLIDGRVPLHFDEVRRLLLAAEVLSPSTARADRVSKRRLYRDVGVDECWIVDLDSRTFERTTPSDDRPEILADRLVWTPERASQSLVVDVPAFFTSVIADATGGATGGTGSGTVL